MFLYYEFVKIWRHVLRVFIIQELYYMYLTLYLWYVGRILLYSRYFFSDC